MEEKTSTTPPSREESLPPKADDDEQSIAAQETGGSFKDYARIFQYADRLSWILNIISLITSIGAGVTLPLMTLVFGDSIGEFNNFSKDDIDPQSFNNTILNSVYVFISSFVMGTLKLISPVNCLFTSSLPNSSCPTYLQSQSVFPQ